MILLKNVCLHGSLGFQSSGPHLNLNKLALVRLFLKNDGGWWSKSKLSLHVVLALEICPRGYSFHGAALARVSAAQRGSLAKVL